MSSPRCCGCIDLKTGCYIIGILSLISHILALVFYGMDIIPLIAVANNTDSNELAHEFSIWMIGFLVIIFVYNLIALIFDCVMISGLNKNRPGRLRAYLIFSWILLTFYCVDFILEIKTTLSQEHIKVHVKVVEFLAAILGILLYIYFLVTINRMYNLMKNETSMDIRIAPTGFDEQFHNPGYGLTNHHNEPDHGNNYKNIIGQSTNMNNLEQNANLN